MFLLLEQMIYQRDVVTSPYLQKWKMTKSMFRIRVISGGMIKRTDSGFVLKEEIT